MFSVSRFGRLALVLATLLTAGGFTHAQRSNPDPSADVVTYEQIKSLLQAGKSEGEILAVLAQSPIATTFTLGDQQVGELKKAGASARLLQALQRRVTVTQPALDITDLVLILDCSGSMIDRTNEGNVQDGGSQASGHGVNQGLSGWSTIGVLIYGHDRKRACQAVDVIRPLSELNPSARTSW